MKKFLLFLMFALFCIPWAANAQTTVTIGEGTSTQNFPLPGFWGYQYDVFLYTPSAASALEADCDISSIAFNVSSNSATAGAQMSIWVKDVDANYALDAATTFSEYTDGATQVYDDSLNSTDGWNTFAFTQNFAHEGGKALLVAVRGVGCTTSGGCSRKCYYTTASNTYWYKRADNNDPGTEVSGSLSSNRANIQLVVTYTGSVCLSPSGLTASNITEEGASFSWNETGSATNWVLQYSTSADFTNPTTVNRSGIPAIAINGLTPLTTYYARVKPGCDAEGIHWSNTVTFTTTAVATVVGDGWSDDFEGASFGWELINGTLTNQWAWGTAANNGGTHGLYISNDSGTSNAYSHSAAIVYATKLLNFTEGKYEFSYDWKANGESSYDYLRVALVPASVTLTAGTTPSGFSSSGLPTGWIALDGGSKLNQVTAWQSKSLAINVTAGNYYLVMAWRNDGGGGTQPPAAVDNVSITRVTCPYDVTDLAVSDITTTEARISWAGGEATQWEVNYSFSSSFDDSAVETVSDSTCNVTGLQPSNTYYVRVRAYCGGEDFGTWSEVISFNTECVAIDLADEDYHENFDDITLTSTYTPSTRTLPICWKFINTSTYTGNAVYPTMYYYSYTDYSHSSPNSLRFYSSYYSYSDYDPQDEYAILPAMNHMAGKQITLWARGYNDNSTLKVGTMTDPTDVATFTEITNDANPVISTSYQEYTYIIPADATDSYVAIMMEAADPSTVTKGIYIDDITIADAPSCPKPTDLEVTASGLSATFTWVSEAEAFEIAITTDDAADPADDIVGTANETTFTMNELALGDYYFWVRANCGNDGYSEWNGPVSFHIGYCVPTPSNVDGNGISNVTFGMGDNVVDNTTPKATYADYTSEIGAVQAGVESTIAITYATGYTYGTIIWVDLDNSLSFEDSEIVYTGTSTNDNPTTLEATITIPATQTPGDYVMRIGGADSGFDSYISDPTTTAPSACYTGNWACFQDYTLRVLEAPSCLTPTGLAVNYTGGITAEVTWEGTAETYNLYVNQEVYNNITSPYTLENLELATTYTLQVEANCDDETSELSNPVSFTTDFCLPENMCEISYSFTDQYNDSWNNAYMNIVDAETEEVLYELTMPDVTGPYEGSFAVCDGRDIQFVWVRGSYPNECGYTFTHNGETILEKETATTAPSAGVVLTYTVNCASDCFKILVDADHPLWSEDFEDAVEANGGYAEGYDVEGRWTGVLPQCWISERLVELPAGIEVDTICQVYRGFNTTEDGQYSLRMHFRSMLVLPELDESVDLGKVRLSMNVRQPYWRYKLEIGVVTEEDYFLDETFVPVAVVNNPDKNMTYFECGFESVKNIVGEGRHIAFRAIGNSENDIYCTNYLDDIKLTYFDNESEACHITETYVEDFESYAIGTEPDCWEVIHEDAPLESTTRPQVFGNYNTTVGGSNSLRLKNRCIYAMPAFGDYSISNFTMTFNLRQPKSIYRLQVGLVDAQGNFNLVKTFKCSNTTDMQPMTVSFDNLDINYGQDLRVAFRNTLVPGTGKRTDYLDYSINYIDDINFFYNAKSMIDANDNAIDADDVLENIAVYPNPTTGNLYIDAMDIQKVECYNQMGQLVRVYDNVENTIDLNNLSEGVYMLRITVPQGVTMRKVVKR